MNQITCPCCGSANIDSERRECRACGVGLPDGALDTPHWRSAVKRAAGRAYAAQKGIAVYEGQSRAILRGDDL